MGLYKQYFRITQHALGLRRTAPNSKDGIALQMLISQPVNHGHLSVIIIGIFTLAMGIILSSIPWLDYIILKNIRLREGSLSFHYWQKPGVIRLTKVYIFNVTNPDGFLRFGERPKLQEVGPFVYKEDMEKVNIKFHDNGTVSYQHKKILKFVPELSVDKNHKLTVPNIPLLTLSTQSNNLGWFVQRAISVMLSMGSLRPFVNVTADELVFGYDDNLVALAHQFYPKRKKPQPKMGLFITRNGTLPEVHTIYTGEKGMQEFGLIASLNGKNTLPYWKDPPCNAINASEGSFFPPRYYTKKDVIYLYDKDICRTFPMQFRESGQKHDIAYDLYTPTDNMFESVKNNPDNKCYCPGNEYCPPKGLQNISPCQYDAPVYISFPHFLDGDPSLLDGVEGLEPRKEFHGSYFKIQPKLGVPLEGKIRVQLNLRVQQAPNILPVKDFRTMVFPIMWLEEGVDELNPTIRRWIYLATTFAEIGGPLMTYGCIFFGTCLVAGVLVNAYKSAVFTKKNIEIGMQNLRRKSSLLGSVPNRFISRNDSTTYTLLDVSDEADADEEESSQ
ncbi:lysosome membrane protein 2 isoform X1 [Euwallacea fornicatus]|uniref:lysosome membrane protein 2 isoform X1 n=2 Tax=Euwallacea fornicatus TaxID=995702 RepID=UPI00338D3510